MEKQMWGDMLDVLKDIGAYLAKSDAELKRADVQKPPKISDNQADEPIVGGTAPGFGPGKGVAKSINKSIDIESPEEPQPNESEEIGARGGTLLKEDIPQEYAEDEDEREFGDDEDEEEGEYGDEEEEEGEEDPRLNNELKSLLKDIRSALIQKSQKIDSSQLTKELVLELKKSMTPIIKDETNRMMRKMGFTPTRPDIVKLGLDDVGEFQGDIKKSQDGKDEVREVEKAVTDLSKKSWNDLGKMRETLGHFKAFGQ